MSIELFTTFHVHANLRRPVGTLPRNVPSYRPGTVCHRRSLAVAKSSAFGRFWRDCQCPSSPRLSCQPSPRRHPRRLCSPALATLISCSPPSTRSTLQRVHRRHLFHLFRLLRLPRRRFFLRLLRHRRRIRRRHLRRRSRRRCHHRPRRPKQPRIASCFLTRARRTAYRASRLSSGVQASR